MILLELFCSFDSAHERAATFHDCRQGKIPKWLTDKKNSFANDVGKMILKCTNKEKRNRPTASEIASYDVVSESKIAKLRDHLREAEIQKLKYDLEKSKSLINAQKDLLREKEDTIGKLREELNTLKKHPNMNFKM